MSNPTTHPKGSQEFNGVWYTPAMQAIMKQLGDWPPAGSSTGPQMYLPNQQILEKELLKQGVPAAKAQALAKQYGLQAIKLPASGFGGSTLSITSAFKTAIASMPPEIAKAVYDRLGLNDARLGKTINTRIVNILPILQASQGHIGNVDVLRAIDLAGYTASTAAMQKALSSYANALSSGNQAALIGATASAKYSAEANADSWMTNLGIDTPEMNKLVSNMVAGGVTNLNEILQNVRQTQTYKKAFAGLAEYNAQPGVVHMTESEYRSYSQAVQGAAQQYGNVHLDQAQIGQLLKGNVTAPEFQQRVQDIGAAVANADPGTKALLQQWYGINPSHLFAYYANPKAALPDMQRAVASAEIGDYAQRVGLGGLKQAGAVQLADMAKLAATQGNNPLGVGVSQIEGSLQNAARDTSLTASAPGAGTPTVNTNNLIASQIAGFGGQNQTVAQTQVARAEQAKAAPFDKGGGYAEDQKGVVGLGSART